MQTWDIETMSWDVQWRVGLVLVCYIDVPSLSGGSDLTDDLSASDNYKKDVTEIGIEVVDQITALAGIPYHLTLYLTCVYLNK